MIFIIYLVIFTMFDSLISFEIVWLFSKKKYDYKYMTHQF